VLVGAALATFVVQAGFVADYPARKFLAILAVVVPIVAAAALDLGAFRAWAIERRWRQAALLGWLAATVAITLLEIRFRPFGGLIGLSITIAAGVGSAAIVALTLLRGRAVTAIATTALALAMLVPIVGADVRFVFRNPAFTYRDAQIAVAPVVNGTTTAGGLSFGMQLYNSSRPVLHGYFFGMTRSEYEQDVVRMFAEGGASSLFDYVDDTPRMRWEALGFSVVETYDITLPRGRVLGRYVFDPAGTAGIAR